MADGTTLNPAAADISPAVIAGMKERSTRWIAALTAAPDGFTLADINHRQRVAMALLQLSVDHHVSLRLLIDAEMVPSARALYRPPIEAYLRGLWAHLCANETQIERFLQSGALPRLDDMLAALEALDRELWSPLFHVKRQIWSRLPLLHDAATKAGLCRTRSASVKYTTIISHEIPYENGNRSPPHAT